MACASQIVELEKQRVHVFRFARSNQTVSLTDEQLERIPYLAALVSNRKNFTCEINEQGEFILKYPFRYTYFMVILAAVTRVRPSFLFSRLPRRANLTFLLELYDYLCIDPLVIPTLETKINPYDKRILQKYNEATPAEARDTAVEFLIAIAKGKYNMKDSKTLNIIFNQIIDILSSPSVFGQRLRYQTVLIIERYCSNMLNSVQRSTLGMYKRSLERLDDTEVDPDIIGETLEGPRTNMFHWRRKLHIENDEDTK